jgi:acetyl-CoA acetyltransferase
MQAYDTAQVNRNDIQFFGLYDCFPICLIRAVEAVGLAGRGEGGKYIEGMYMLSEKQGGVLEPTQFPINTHGGLLAFGAPWEVPAMYNVIEAVRQLNQQAGAGNSGRQVPNCRRALVYGNGGIFSASAVAVLGSGNY